MALITSNEICTFLNTATGKVDEYSLLTKQSQRFNELRVLRKMNVDLNVFYCMELIATYT